jgi:uncharacterized integral membrane protein
MGKFIGIIVVLVLILVFSGFNLNNRTDISFGFAKIEQVPVYITALSFFVLGLVCSVPVIVTRRFKKSHAQEEKPQKDLKPKKKGGLLAKSKNKLAETESEDQQIA